MANLPDIFLNWQSAAIALFIYAMTESFRRGVQSTWKSWRTSKIYTEFVLFVLPVITGVVMALVIPSIPWPSALTTASSRALYAAVLGLFAGMVYGRAKVVVSDLFASDSKNKA